MARNKVVKSFYIKPSNYKWLVEAAQINDRSLSYFVDLALDRLIEEVSYNGNQQECFFPGDPILRVH